MGADVKFLEGVVGAAGGDVERVGGWEAADFHATAEAADVREAAAELLA
jgi:hypothetical protein